MVNEWVFDMGETEYKHRIRLDKAIRIHGICIGSLTPRWRGPTSSNMLTVSKKQISDFQSTTVLGIRPPLHALGGLCNPGLLGVRPGRARHDALAAQELSQADLGVDLGHALEIGLGRAFGAEDEVLLRVSSLSAFA